MTDRYKTRTFAPLDRIKVIEACEKSIAGTATWLQEPYETRKMLLNGKWGVDSFLPKLGKRP